MIMLGSRNDFLHEYIFNEITPLTFYVKCCFSYRPYEYTI